MGTERTGEGPAPDVRVGADAGGAGGGAGPIERLLGVGAAAGNRALARALAGTAQSPLDPRLGRQRAEEGAVREAAREIAIANLKLALDANKRAHEGFSSAAARLMSLEDSLDPESDFASVGETCSGTIVDLRNLPAGYHGRAGIAVGALVRAEEGAAVLTDHPVGLIRPLLATAVEQLTSASQAAPEPDEPAGAGQEEGQAEEGQAEPAGLGEELANAAADLADALATIDLARPEEALDSVAGHDLRLLGLESRVPEPLMAPVRLARENVADAISALGALAHNLPIVRAEVSRAQGDAEAVAAVIDIEREDLEDRLDAAIWRFSGSGFKKEP